jgi:hypothetical protein
MSKDYIILLIGWTWIALMPVRVLTDAALDSYLPPLPTLVIRLFTFLLGLFIVIYGLNIVITTKRWQWISIESAAICCGISLVLYETWKLWFQTNLFLTAISWILFILGWFLFSIIIVKNTNNRNIL